MTQITKPKQVIGLALWFILVFAAAAIGAVASVESGAFYSQLVRPLWAPPPWLFSPAWTILYIIMGISAWLVWRVGGFRPAYAALSLFIVQLAVNALWTWIFFVWKQGALAFVEILVLWALILGTMIAFWRVRPLAGILLIPYLAWVTFASALTLTIWRLNPLLL
ncbi:MAG: tryptophan-rich sensory protein [Deltaproteobacteria bacterium]|nr:tryptophan-rich sensory protein [Deltaproteobacteria bacterium]